MSGKAVPLQGEESESPCAVADIPKAQVLLPWLHRRCFYTFPLALWAAEEYVKALPRQRVSLATSLEAEERSCLAKACSGNATVQQFITTLCPFSSACPSVLWTGTGDTSQAQGDRKGSGRSQEQSSVKAVIPAPKS